MRPTCTCRRSSTRTASCSCTRSRRPGEPELRPAGRATGRRADGGDPRRAQAPRASGAAVDRRSRRRSSICSRAPLPMREDADESALRLHAASRHPRSGARRACARSIRTICVRAKRSICCTNCMNWRRRAGCGPLTPLTFPVAAAVSRRADVRLRRSAALPVCGNARCHS